MKPKEMQLEDMDWINLAQNESKGRIFVNRVVNILDPYNSAILLGRKMTQCWQKKESAP
jgi:hypothetical protein